VAPNGVAFAPPGARVGVLPRMLQEILDTRIMVKNAMKRAPKSAKVSGKLQRRVHDCPEFSNSC
jgi:DNA polymerase elongation subunit (family B)